jgi:Xaa-Pro dipeptidase
MTPRTQVAGAALGPDVSPPERAAEVARRIELVADRLAELGAGGVVLASRRNVAWLTAGGMTHVVLASETAAAPVLVTAASEAIVLAPNNEAARIADEELAGLPIEVASLPWPDRHAIPDEAERRTGRTPVDDQDVEEWLIDRRSVLVPFESSRVAWLGGRVRQAIDAALSTIAPGATEDEAVAEMTSRLARDGIRAAVVLAAADERIQRYRHPLPRSSRIRDRLMLIAVGERWGLHAAYTGIRDFEPPPREIAARMVQVRAVHDEMVRVSRPGATLGDVFEAARTAYAKAGVPDEWTLHHQGGTIGYQPRETIAGPGDRTVIEPGMALAWNPSITGAKAESTILVKHDGPPVDVTRAQQAGRTDRDD